MAISVKSITLSIDGDKSSEWNINIGGEDYHLDNFSLRHGLLSPSVLSFTLTRDPEEKSNDPLIKVCGIIVGKEVSLLLQTMGLDTEDESGEIEFKGFITGAYGSRSGTEYYVNVEAHSWDALLDDSPTCKSFENMTLSEIVEDVVEEYNDKIAPIINPRFQEKIPYCVQYNENNYQFLQRLARRYGEWLYNNGTQMVFGQLDKQETVSLGYPSKEVPSYSMDLHVQHLAFSHLASSYNANAFNQKEGLEEMQLAYNDISDQAFQTSQDIYTKHTIQNLHSGGYARAEREDSRETVLNISTKTQARGEKASMQTFNGTTYCSKVKIGGTLNITDNYVEGVKRSSVPQVTILITELAHHFSVDHSYRNLFNGIPEKCDYPPYSNSDVYPIAPSCRAKVTDNEDPNGLGRIRVQFDWQAEQDSDMMTPWLRMAQPYAGGGKGFSFIPEIGEEVMIDFEGGNAERPYVKGTLYNGEYDVDAKWVANSNSANQVKAIRTRNGHTIEIHDEGNDGYIRIYDNEKENYILTFSTDQKLIKLESTGNIELYAQNDIIMHAGHDINASADNDLSISAGNDMRQSAGHDRTIQVGHNQTKNIDKNEFIQIGQNKDEKVDLTSQLSAKNIRIEADLNLSEYSTTHQQSANATMNISANAQVDIKGGVVKVN